MMVLVVLGIIVYSIKRGGKVIKKSSIVIGTKVIFFILALTDCGFIPPRELPE